MNSSDEEGNGGASIIPSARKSIHNHGSFCPFSRSEVTMVRYGLPKTNTRRELSVSPSHGGPGRDEVDNVMSKHALPIIPTSSARENKHRRNSLIPHTQEYDAVVSDDDESHMFSKSLPANFPTSSHYSNDSEEPETSYRSYYSTANNNSRNRTVDCIHPIQLESVNQSAEPQCEYNEDQSNRNSTRKLWLVISIAVGVLSIVLCGKMYGLTNTSDRESGLITANKYDKLKFYNDMYSLGEKYKLDEDSILQLQTGISSISEKQDTDSFMFVYNSETNHFNPTIFNNFVNEIASISAKYLRNESTTVRHTVVHSSHLVLQDPTELIDKYSGDVARGGVMLLTEIHMLPASLAMALHYYCDEYNPLVKKSAMFFTLNMAHCSQASEQRSTHAHIEKCLAKKWNSVPADNIGPLLTRVVSVVVDVTSAF